MTRAIRTNSRYLRYAGSATVASTSERIRDRVIGLLEAMGVKYYVSATNRNPSRHKTSWVITVNSNAATTTLLRTLRPFLIEKGVQADIVLEYLEWRLSQPTRPGGSRNKRIFIEGMKEVAEEAMARLREDRFRNDPSETARLAPGMFRCPSKTPERFRVMTQSEL